MQRIAFTMKLFKGQEAEYKRRHDEIWPELKALFEERKLKEFSIFLDEASGILFACLSIEDASKLDDLPEHPVQKKWWAYMKDIMETNEDNSPARTELKEVFHIW